MRTGAFKLTDDILVEITWASINSVDSRPLVRDLLFGLHHDMLPELKPKLMRRHTTNWQETS